MNFSVVLIAKNESYSLPRLMASLLEFRRQGGEIVLVDTGSTDNTPEIAKWFDCVVFEEGERFVQPIGTQVAKVINRSFVVPGEEHVVTAGAKLFDYSSARNYAASLAKNDIVWMPDCDEAFTAFDLTAIDAAIADGAEQLEYDFIYAHDELGRPGLRFTHSKCYDRRKMQWTGLVHEVLTGSGKRVYLPPDKVLLEHYQVPSDSRGRYLAGLAMDCFLNPEKDRNSHYFAREMFWTGRYKSAIKEFERHIAMNAWLPERAQSMIFIGDAYLALGKDDEALVSYHRAFIADGSRREALIRLAEYYYKKGDHQHTAAYASAALTIPWNSYYANQVAHYEHWPHEMLYWALWDLDRTASKYHFDKAYAYLPNIPKYQAARKLYYPEESAPKELEWTGERYLPGKTPYVDVEQEHLARYRFASQFTLGLDVLDAACGEGYGKTILQAQGYVGWDIDPLTIDLARKRYGFRYDVVDLEKILLKEFEIDAVVSFETIEHLSDPHPFLQWASEHSKLFIGSIPLDMPSEFHKVVYAENDARKLIRQYWPDASFWWQNGERIETIMDHWQYLVFLCGPKVSIVIPTLGREERLEPLRQLIHQNAGYPNYEIIMEHDSFGPARQGTPKTLKRGVGRSTGSLVMYLGNDCLPRPGFLLKALKAMIRQFPDMDGLVGLNDGYWHGEFATHWLASKKLLPMLDGEFFHTGYNHTGCDNELTARCKAAGKYFWAQDAEVYHDHPVQTGFKPEDMDDVYWLAYDPKSVEADRELLQQRAKQFGIVIPEWYERPETVS